jgi:hypothetical protein
MKFGLACCHFADRIGKRTSPRKPSRRSSFRGCRISPSSARYFIGTIQVDIVRTVSATCPSGRPISGGLSIEKGNGSLRIHESYPDGATWVTRAVNRRSATPAQPLQVRAFAVCLLPIARRDSVQIAQYPRLLQLSHRFALTPGDITTAERQACTQNTLGHFRRHGDLTPNSRAVRSCAWS